MSLHSAKEERQGDAWRAVKSPLSHMHGESIYPGRSDMSGPLYCGDLASRVVWRPHYFEEVIVDEGGRPLNSCDLAYHLFEDRDNPDNEVSSVVSCACGMLFELFFSRILDSFDFCPEVSDLCIGFAV